MIDLKKTKAICEVATAGPWDYEAPEDEHPDTLCASAGDGSDREPPTLTVTWPGDEGWADVRFIEHARTTLPELVEWAEKAKVGLRAAAEILAVDGMRTVAARLESIVEQVEPKKDAPPEEPDTVPREWWDGLKAFIRKRRFLVSPDGILKEMHALENGR